MLRQYDQIMPGLVNRIVTMAEAQSSHRQAVEAKVIGGNVWAQKWGLVAAFAVATTAIVLGWELIHSGHSASGLTSILGALGSLAGTFIFGKVQQQREREQKRDEVRAAAGAGAPDFQ